MPPHNDSSLLFKDCRVDDGLKRSVSPDPHLDWVIDAFELEGAPVVDVRADILRVGEDLVNGGPGPCALVLPGEALAIQPFSDLALRHSLVCELLIDVPDHRNLLLRTRYQDDAVSLQALIASANSLVERSLLV